MDREVEIRKDSAPIGKLLFNPLKARVLTWRGIVVDNIWGHKLVELIQIARAEGCKDSLNDGLVFLGHGKILQYDFFHNRDIVGLEYRGQAFDRCQCLLDGPGGVDPDR